MKTLVVYKSKSGYTQKYAQWIAEELSADILESSKASVRNMKEYDTVIYGGGVYANSISGVKLITRNLKQLKDKNIVVFATGLTSPEDKGVNEITNKNFTPEQLKHIRFFYLRGGFDFNKLGFLYKTVMKQFTKMNSKKEQNEDEKALADACQNPVDYTNRDNIRALVEYVKR
jgi:menaquinone-dependent protoporphyrinogen IX oxidase